MSNPLISSKNDILIQMKILYVITKSEPYGGAQKYVYDMALAAQENGHNVTVAAGLKGRLIDKLLKKDIRVLPIDSFQRSINIFKDATAFFEILFLFLKEKPNIIHLNSSKAGGVGAFVARIYNLFQKREEDKISIVFTGHGWAFSEERPLWQKIALYILQVLTTLLSHVTIAVSAYNRRELLRHPLPFIRTKIEKKLTFIPNGIEDFEMLDMREARKELIQFTALKGSVDLWSTETLWIGMIAELTKNKGVDRALEILKNVQDKLEKHSLSAVLFVMGSGEDKPKLERLIRQNNLDSSAFLLGYIPDARKYLKAFDIYLMSSRKEGLPYVLLEAAHAGVPIVTTPVGGIPDIVGQHPDELPETNEELAENILELAQNPEKRVRYGKFLKKRVNNHFSSKQMTMKTMALYNRFRK